MTQAQNSTLALGMTGISVLAGAAFSVWDDRFIAVAVFLGAVPLVATMIFVLWVSQVVGMLQIGEYLSRLEKTIRDGLGAPEGLMTWERQIAERSGGWWPPTYDLHYPAVRGLLVLLTAGSIALGTYRAFADHAVEAIVGASVVTFFSALLFLVFGRAVLHAQRERAKTAASAAA